MFKCSAKLYIGMDVSEEKIEIFALPRDCDEGRHWQIENSRESLVAFCDSVKEPSAMLMAMESGTHSAWHSEMLEARGFQVVVGNARKLAAVWQNKNKSDRQDAEMLARLARSDLKLFCPVRHISMSARADLAVIKTREGVSKCRTALMNTVRGLLRSHGIATQGLTSDNFTAEASKIVPKQLRAAMSGILKEIRSLQMTIKAYDKLVDKLNKKYPDTARVRQIHGVGPLTALAFILMVDDPKRFPDGSRVGKYFGLTPKRDQSGNVDKQLGITKEGNRIMRWLLVQCANHIMSRAPDCDLRRFGERIAARGGKIAKRKAKVAVARKVAKLMLKLWLSGETYDPEHKTHCIETRKMNKSEEKTVVCGQITVTT